MSLLFKYFKLNHTSI